MLKSESDIQNIIDDSIDNYLNYGERKDREIGVYWISELPWCLRKLFFKFKYRKQIDPSLLRIFKLGNMLQYILEQAFRNSKQITLLSSERSVALTPENSDFVLNGRLDELVHVGIGGEDPAERFVLELKSTRSIAFHKTPMKQHVMQIMPYMRVLNIKRGFIVYIDRSTLKIKALEVKFDPEILKEMFERAKTIHEALLADTPPTVNPSDKYAWECEHCEFNDECKESMLKNMEVAFND